MRAAVFSVASLGVALVALSIGDAEAAGGTPDDVVEIANNLIAELSAQEMLNVRSDRTDHDPALGISRVQGFRYLTRIFRWNAVPSDTILAWTAPGETGRPAWCGVMVNAIYLEAKVPGIKAWPFDGSGFGGRRSEFHRLTDAEPVQPGDACAKVEYSHHVLVVDVNETATGQVLDILQGNGNLEAITWPTSQPRSWFGAGCYRPIAWYHP